MTELEVIDLLERICSYSPGMSIGEKTSTFWHELLFDIPAEAANAAVRAHYATSHSWITPADIRRHVARQCGVLPPDADIALAQARAWSEWRGPARDPWPTEGEPELHPAVRAAGRIVGWTWLDETPNRFARGPWRDAYTSAAEEATRRALAPGGIAAIRAEITAGTPRPALEAPPPEAPLANIDPERVAKLRGEIARIATRKAPPAPRPDYDPPSEIERDRQLAELRRWAADRGTPIDPTSGAA